jgi:hypothetical protein
VKVKKLIYKVAYEQLFDPPFRRRGYACGRVEGRAYRQKEPRKAQVKVNGPTDRSANTSHCYCSDAL